MKNNQFGRSMIEMLGVLAIIGVLSVGGIAGYSKAMMKFRVNKTVDQIAHIATNVRAFYSSQRSYRDITQKVLCKAQLVPSEMKRGTADCSNTTAFENVFGGIVSVNGSSKINASPTVGGGSDFMAFVISFEGIPEEACLELATLDWGASSGDGLMALGVNSQVSGYYIGHSGYVGKMGNGYGVAIPNDANYPVPMSPSNAVNACGSKSNNTIRLKFY